jgi:hypothetical protein
MARDLDHEDEDTPESDARTAAAAVEKITTPADDDTPMTVSEDGTVSFGDVADRGEKTGKQTDDDDEMPDNLTEDEREKLRAKRREEKKRRREAARERENALKGENAALHQTVNELANRLQQVEQRTTSIDVSKLDADLRDAAYALQSWQAVLEKAVENADGPGVREAMDNIRKAEQHGQRLYQARQAVDHQAAQAAQRGRPAVDPEIMSRVDRWRAKHGWYNPAQPNRDTRIALAVDADVANDGYKPNTDEFWSELDRRLREVLPTRYEDLDDDDDAPAPATGRGGSPAAPAARNRRVPASGGGGNGSAASPGFKLSAERVNAMKDAGVWNDQVKRDKMIRTFMQYDKANKKGA